MFKFGIDGNKYFCLLGEDIQSGICAFGDDLYDTFLYFHWHVMKEMTMSYKKYEKQINKG